MKILKPKVGAKNIIEETRALPGVSDSIIWISNEEKGLLSVLVSSVDGDAPIIYGQGITGRCYMRGDSVVVDDFEVELQHQDDPDRIIAIIELVRRKGWRSAYCQTLGSDNICQKIGIFGVFSKSEKAFRNKELLCQIDEIASRLKEVIFFQTAYRMNEKIGALRRKLSDFEKLLPNLMAVRFAVGGEIHDSINDLGIAKRLLGEIVTEDTARVRELSQHISNVLSNLGSVNAHREALAEKLSKRKEQVSRLIKNIETRFRPVAEAQKICFTVEKPEFGTKDPSEVYINVDKARLEQVFHNLIHNSMYHITHDPGRKRKARKNTGSSFQGIIEVSIELSDDSIVFTVLDNGEGCAEGVLDHVMDEFYSSRGTKAARGTGFGLAIAKHYVIAHGGKIGVRSDWGESFEVRFSLPLS